MQYEKNLLERLTELRSQTKDTNLDENQKEKLNKRLDQAIQTFNITIENYPVLKADKQFTYLQASLNECEGQLAAARRTYNAAVMNYNNTIEVFPTNIVASQIGYKHKNMIKYSETENNTLSKDSFL